MTYELSIITYTIKEPFAVLLYDEHDHVYYNGKFSKKDKNIHIKKLHDGTTVSISGVKYYQVFSYIDNDMVGRIAVDSDTGYKSSLAYVRHDAVIDISKDEILENLKKINYLYRLAKFKTTDGEFYKIKYATASIRKGENVKVECIYESVVDDPYKPDITHVITKKGNDFSLSVDHSDMSYFDVIIANNDKSMRISADQFKGVAFSLPVDGEYINTTSELFDIMANIDLSIYNTYTDTIRPLTLPEPLAYKCHDEISNMLYLHGLGADWRGNAKMLLYIDVSYSRDTSSLESLGFKLIRSFSVRSVYGNDEHVDCTLLLLLGFLTESSGDFVLTTDLLLETEALYEIDNN